MAEGLFRDLIKGRSDIEVSSAGIGAMNGQPPSPYAIDVMKEIGIDISGLRSAPVTAALVAASDYIFVMTYGHLDSILLLFPAAADKTFLLNEAGSENRQTEREIPDPIGGSCEIYRQCRDQIKKALPKILDMVSGNIIKRSEVTNMTKSVCVAADHGGVDLKKIVCEWLTQHEFKIKDFGTFTSESVDYPDYASQVGRAVASGQADCGILLCKSGIGMSIAANKIPGIRAALVYSVDMARLCREHNNANIICLAANDVKPKKAKDILAAFFNTDFAGGRHAVRVDKIENMETQAGATGASSAMGLGLQAGDPTVYEIIRNEARRQCDNIELIASENFTSLAVMEAQGSCLTNKYAEGYPGRRWYGGCEFVDEAEQLAINRAKQLFQAEYVNVQPHSGSQANMAVYFAFLKPGDTILTMELTHGGHLTHGNKMNFSGRFYQVVHYGVSKDTETINYDQLAEMATQHRPKMITAGASAYPRFIDFERMRKIADSIESLLLVDMAHIAGLVAAGLHPSPVPHADFVTTTTHKTLRGPRGGLIMAREKYAKEIDSQTFPGIQGGPLMHVIAAKAVCLGEALLPSFKTYQQQVLNNAKALCEGMKKNGYRIVSGTTDNHLMLVDLQPKNITGKEAQEALDHAGITVNKNAIPFDTQSPFKAGGIRLGSPAVTTRGMKEDEMFDIANLIHEALSNRTDKSKLESVRSRVREITQRFPLPY